MIGPPPERPPPMVARWISISTPPPRSTRAWWFRPSKPPAHSSLRSPLRLLLRGIRGQFLYYWSLGWVALAAGAVCLTVSYLVARVVSPEAGAVATPASDRALFRLSVRLWLLHVGWLPPIRPRHDNPTRRLAAIPSASRVRPGRSGIYLKHRPALPIRLRRGRRLRIARPLGQHELPILSVQTAIGLHHDTKPRWVMACLLA